jgi:hypothetical protein
MQTFDTDCYPLIFYFYNCSQKTSDRMEESTSETLIAAVKTAVRFYNV